MKQLVKLNGVECACYGELEETSNIQCVFEDESLDIVWCDGNMDTDGPFKTWVEAFMHINQVVGEPPVQLEAI